MTIFDPLDAGSVRLGIVVRLPADGAVTLATRSGLTFIVVDIDNGPLDEPSLRRLGQSARPAGIAVVAQVGRTVDPDRLGMLGVDEVIHHVDGELRLGTDEPLVVVASIEEARRAIGGGATTVALDIDDAVDALVRAFSTVAEPAGSHDPLVLLAGMLGDARLFDGVAAALPPTVRCQPLRIDLDDSVEEIAQSVLAIAPPRFALAGHSLGGIVALEVCRQAPDRVARLALLNTSARPPSDAQRAAWSTLLERVEAGPFGAVAHEEARVNLGSVAEDRPELVRTWADMAARVGPDGLRRQLRAQSTRPDSRPSLARIAVPTLVLTGSVDAVCPAELQEELADGIRGAVHVTIEGAGHMSPLDHPDQVAAQIAVWLSS